MVNHPLLEMKAKGFCASQEGNFFMRINIERVKIELEESYGVLICVLSNPTSI